MRRLLLSLSLLAAACGSVDDRDDCTTSAQCGQGRYCAHTDDGNVCWDDATPPVVSAVTVTCSTSPCLRDSTLTVAATASDDAELAAVEVALDLEATRWVALTRSGGSWTGQLPLRGWDFPFFSHPVTATARARDGAQQEATRAATPVDVTRLRWAVEAKAGSTSALSPPALQPDGTVVVGNAAGELLFVSPNGTPPSSPVAVGGIISSVAVGDQAIWVGNQDASLKAVSLQREGLLENVTVSVGGAIVGSLAVVPGTSEWTFAGGAGSAGQLGGASSTPHQHALTTPANYQAGAVATSSGKVCGVAFGAASNLVCFSFVAGALDDDWVVSVGTNVSVGMAIDASGYLITGSEDAKVRRTSADGVTSPFADLSGAISDSPVVLGSGHVVVGDSTGALHRFTAAGTATWSPAPNLGGVPLAPMALAGGDTSLVVATQNGKVFALAGDGSTVWTTTFAGNPVLKGSNVSLPSAESPVTSTAYFSAANGRVYAVIVDGTLDTAAPWPKAFRDRRNRSNASLP